jgi:DNA mismatch repair protein MutH
VRDIEETLRCLGIDEDSIIKSLSQLSELRPGELARVADLEVADEILRETGFLGVA